MSTPKWIPKHSEEVLRLFEDARQLERDLRVLANKFATNVNLSLPDYYEFGQLLNQSRTRFKHSDRLQCSLAKLSAMSSNKRIERSPYKVLQSKRANICRHNLKRRHGQLVFVVHKMIKIMLGCSMYLDSIVDSALALCNLHNESVALTQRNSKPVSGAQACSNSFPGLLLPAKKFDMSMILQTISKQRSEVCCLSLISCLLASCKPETGTTDDSSDTSSVEILKALTVHLSSPAVEIGHTDSSKTQQRPKSAVRQVNSNFSSPFRKSVSGVIEKPLCVRIDAEHNDPSIDFFDKMVSSNLLDGPSADNGTEPFGCELLDQLVSNEENYIANVLLKCLKLCPSSFDEQPSKAEIIKWVNRGTRGLWTQVGSTLEHVVLWWNTSPLACQQTECARYLRDWLLIIQPDDAPEPILSTLQGLGETLTVYVAGTTWDKQFRLSLVSGITPFNKNFDGVEVYSATNQLNGTATGRLWSELLHSLTAFSNSCDRNGTIPNELPIVEQIPVLHRLDHSIHTMRLWAAAQAKAVCTNWSMTSFFQVVHHDVNRCLEQLNELRVPDLVPSDTAEVLVQVCVALRAKLVSEIKVNIGKLKQTYGECIDVMATICRTISLATLSLCFPVPKLWQSNDLQDSASDYVSFYLDQLYLPIVEATQVSDILRLVLKIICEAWLDHIYIKRIKFSRAGAVNLLTDFDGVAQWIESCKLLDAAQVEMLVKHEVLKMCEGVAKILLRKPDEVISMESRSVRPSIETNEEDKGQLPPEMFVPNQKRWLELRARNRGTINCILCACVKSGSSS